MRLENHIWQKKLRSQLTKTLGSLAIALLGMPVQAQAQAVNPIDWRYTVRPQDTVSDLTRQYLKPGISWKMLAEYNRLPEPNVIHAGTQLRLPLKWLALKQAQARLTAISGDVRIQSQEGVWRPARVNEFVQIGQRIQVGNNSSARLQFADATELVMQPETAVSMDTLSVYGEGFMADTQVRLQSGRIEIDANPQGRAGQKFNVITPAAVASVRGTRFMVESKGIRTLEQTSQGRVALETSQGVVMVQEGYASAVNQGEKPQTPELIKEAPKLQDQVDRFSTFPIQFRLLEQADVSGWVMQLGLDPKMAQLAVNQQSTSPLLDLGALPDGTYFLRAWSLDAKGMPSQIRVHPFEVAMARKPQGPAVKLPPNYFANGPMTLQLPPLPHGQRYLVQLTLDAQGTRPVWYKADAGAVQEIPPPADSGQTYHLWVWVY